MTEPEWREFAVGEPSTGPGWNRECCPFSEVRHIAHMSDAFRIVEDDCIRSSLIWDESRLNTTRACVAWVSPNSWVYGSIYGSVSFEFNWPRILGSARLYWVEVIRRYSPPAFRILAADSVDPAWGKLEEYDPEAGDGPLYLCDGQWYWNGRYTGEFMLARDLSLSECSEVSFVRHHRDRCKKSGSACPDLDLLEAEAGARFLAHALGRGLTQLVPLLLDGNAEQLTATFDCSHALQWLEMQLRSALPDGEPKVSDLEEAASLLRSALLSYGLADASAAKTSAALLGNEEFFTDAMDALLEGYFGTASIADRW